MPVGLDVTKVILTGPDVFAAQDFVLAAVNQDCTSLKKYIKIVFYMFRALAPIRYKV